MLQLIIESVSLAYLFGFLTPASAWQQAITTDGSSEFRVKVQDYGGDVCHNRNGGPEGVMGIMNTRNSDQLKAMAFWDIAGCDRVDPERYSLFIHWYDLPTAIQLLDLGLPGLEHRWKSFRHIIPNSPSWINFRNPGKGKYIPGPDGMTPIGGFYADLMEKIPPGSIRYRIMGTNEYITVKDAIFVPKTVSTGESLIEDKLLDAPGMAEARETLRAQVSNWFYATGGVPTHLLQTKDYIFHERVSQAYVEAAQPANFGKIKNPGVLVVKQMLGEYRYPQGEDKIKAQVDAANDERQRIEKLELESQALKYTQLLQKKYMEALDRGEPVVFPSQTYADIVGMEQPIPEDNMGTNQLINPTNSQMNLQQQQNQTQTGNIIQPTFEETFESELIQSMEEDPSKGYKAGFGPFNPSSDLRQEPGIPSDPSLQNSFVDMARTDPEDFFRQQLMAPGISQTYNDLDRDSIDVLDPQYLRRREALKSKSLNELDWGLGNVDPWTKLGIPNLGSQIFDLGLTNQNQGVVAASEQPVSSFGEVDIDDRLLNVILSGNQLETQENDMSRFEEEKLGAIDEW
ncbi:hypothetical protein TWF506_007324 [Arthrobotrys conoides]|uniref:Uncharacterized protein n=1 Tax=Arthrobotrys conoides TaxID=74498 RepID=A0AAN8NK21_9PEZI